MKLFISFLLIFAMLAVNTPVQATSSEIEHVQTTEYTQTTDTVPEISSNHGIDANNALLGLDKLVNNVRAAFVYEANSETLMYAWNADERMYPASLVKIMTVLLALEKADRDDLVTVSQGAISSVPSDAVSAKLQPGEKLSVQDLLYCILMGSASDACVALAEHIGGTELGFVEMMNQRAKELGCSGTHFTNSHGLHDDDQYTTARDAARILSKAMKNKSFRDIFTADNYTIEKTNLSEIRKLTGGNYMKDSSSRLYYDSRVIGGRTGVTQDGRRCLATAAERNGMLLITVVMGSESVYQEDGFSAISIGGYRETTKLLDTCLDGYKSVQLLHENQSIRQIPVQSGDCDLVIGPKVSVATVLPVNISTDDLTYRYSDKAMTVPIVEGQHVSDLQIWHGSMCIAEAEMYALNDVAPEIHGSSQSDTEKDNNSSTILWILLIVFVLVVSFLIIRYYSRVRGFFRRKKNRRCDRNRRRNH